MAKGFREFSARSGRALLLGVLTLVPSSLMAVDNPDSAQHPLTQLSLEQLGSLQVTSVNKAPEEVWKTPRCHLCHHSGTDSALPALPTFPRPCGSPPESKSHAGTRSSAPFLICILGDDPFGPVLDRTIANETLGGRAVQDRRITRPQDATVCSILYISSSESSRLSKILSSIQGAPVLTVSDIPDFVQQGGMIQFVLREGRVRFEVNVSATQAKGLSMSSELLKVAVQVVRAGGSY